MRQQMERKAEHPLARFLAINRTVGIVLVTVLLFGLGEELWQPFMPELIRAQNKELALEAQSIGSVGWATLLVVGVYGCLRNLFEGFCYIGGGRLTAWLGDRGALILFAALTIAGYLIFLSLGTAWPWAAILAAMLILGWEPLSVPVTFTAVGSTVTSTSQGVAFAVQSIQKRLPKILGPLAAGLVVDHLGRIEGMRILVASALALSLTSLAIQVRWMPHRQPPPPGPPSRQILRELHPSLRRLLLAEVFTRWCDWLVRDFVLLYVVVVHQVDIRVAGLLFGLQHFTALLTYLPIGQMTKRLGLQPFIGVTFVFFALFPLVLALTPDPAWLFVAYVVYGLREIGEPARKALITSLMPEAVRARGVGLYWGIRSFAICTASLVGAFLWGCLGPLSLLYTAFALGCVGAVIFYLFCYTRPVGQDSDPAV